MTLHAKHNLNDIGKCCGFTAQKLSKQIPIQDILGTGLLIREGVKKSKWKIKMAFAMKGGGVSKGSTAF